MDQFNIVAEVKSRLISRGLLTPCAFDDMHEEMTAVINGINEMFPKTGSSLFSFWMGEYQDPDNHEGFFTRNTYHNRAHILTALHRVLVDRDISKVFHTSTPRDERAAVLTLLLHDVYHGCGTGNDSSNIARALPIFTMPYQGEHFPVLYAAGVAEDDFCADVGLTSFSALEDMMATCRELILQSEYPYVRPVTHLGGILRDVDRLAMLSRDYFEEVYEGLYAEVTVKNHMSFVSFCRNQIVFTKEFTWYNKDLEVMLKNSPRMLEAEKLGYLVYDVAREVAAERIDL